MKIGLNKAIKHKKDLSRASGQVFYQKIVYNWLGNFFQVLRLSGLSLFGDLCFLVTKREY